MSIIGNFEKKGDNYVGTIKTMALNANVKFVPNESAIAGAPNYRVYVNGNDMGAAWDATLEDDTPYLSVKIDDPSFNAPITPALFFKDEDSKAVLVWNRLKPQTEMMVAAE